MKITRIEAVPVSIPLRRTFNIASGAIPTGRNVIILVHTYGGMKGLGEASPISSTDADTQRSIRKGQLGCPEGQTMSAAQQFYSFAV